MINEVIRLGILISGEGTTAQAVIRSCKDGELSGKVIPTVVISSKENAGGIKKAEDLGVDVQVVRKNDYPNSREFGEAIFRYFDQYKVTYFAQLGWTAKTPHNVVERFAGRSFNQHPGSLDPGRKYDFGGQGMIGARVICTAVAFAWMGGLPTTEATTHHVTDEYDQGGLVRTMVMDLPILGENIKIENLRRDALKKQLIETTLAVQRKMLPLEHLNVIKTLLMFSQQGIVPGHRRITPLITQGMEENLMRAKQLAIELFPMV